MAQDIDFASLMEPVARHYLGEPNKRLSNKKELRWGTNGSFVVYLDKGTWYSFEDEESGGVLDFISMRTGCDSNGQAVEILKSKGFVSNDPIVVQDTKKPGKIVATYDYVDEFGEFIFQVVRFDPKDFRQRRRPTKEEANGKEWIWSVKGCRQVPYRLPELVEAISEGHTVFIAEGEKKVDRLFSMGVPATCNAMGAGKWHDDLTRFFTGADVVILPDNDAQAKHPDGKLRFHEDGRPVYTGHDHAALVAAKLQGIAAKVRILALGGTPEPPHAGPLLPPKGDIIEWTDAGGTVEKLWALVEKIGETTAEKPRLHFGSVWFADVDTAIEDPEWLVDDLLTSGDTSLIYGPSKSGKSFLATHFSMAIARGVEVFGRRVRQGGVVYVAAEGRKGFKKRLKAYRKENSLKDGTKLPFLLVPAAVNMFAKEGDIDKLLADLRAIEPDMKAFGVSVDLIVFDTYAAVSPGANENASEDVSRIVSNCRRVWEVYPLAHIMIVHHKNAAGDKPRGHTSLYAGIDNAIEVTCDEAKNRSARIDKMKDGEDGFSIGFRLQTVTIAQRDDGKPITSCVVVPADAVASRNGKGQGMSDQQRIALQALREALIVHGEPAPSSLQLPFGVRVVHVKAWKEEFLRCGFDETPNESTFRMAFKRVGEALLAKHIIGRDQPYIWIAREPSQVQT